MAVTQIRGNTQIMADTITNAEINSGAAIELSKLEEAVIQADGGQAFTANQSMGNNKLVSVANGTNPNDGVNLSQLEGAMSGLDIKDSVRVATTTNGALATAYEDADTLDSITLATGDRILLKDQTTGSENGIYTVNASGAPTRSTDADENAEVTPGMFCFVEEGGTNADTGWVLTNDGTVTVGTTALTFAQFTGAGTITAGTGMTKTGSTLNVISGNGGIVANADDITLTLDGSTLTVGASGIKLADLTSTNLLVGNGSNVATGVAMSGDAAMDNAGAVTLASNVLKEADFVPRETPTGTINGSNTTFTLASTPISGTEHLYQGGMLQNAGGSNDYTISGDTITYNTAPETGSILLVSYWK